MLYITFTGCFYTGMLTAKVITNPLIADLIEANKYSDSNLVFISNDILDQNPNKKIK